LAKRSRYASAPRIVTIGGGTGNFVVLRGLKRYPVELTAVVSMADDGGSTGVLRDELGVLPPGDVRQCLVALSNSSRLMRSLMNYRFEQGGLGGHSFGNLLLSALEKVTGSFEKAVEEAARILNIRGRVIPVTTHQVRLKMLLHNRKLLQSEREIYYSEEIDQGYDSIYLEPIPVVNPHAIDEIRNADMIVLGPGGLYTSLIPNLLVPGLAQALRESAAHKVFVVNLMNRKGQTTGFSVGRTLQEIARFIGADIFDTVLVNNADPAPELLDLYRNEGDLVTNDLVGDPRVVLAPLLDDALMRPQKGDLVKRNLIRHHSTRLAEELMQLVPHL
jgi:uncharacterized cofD-like protein